MQNTSFTEKRILIEASLLKSLMKYKDYESYIGSLDVTRLMPNTRLLIEDFGKYYKLYTEDVDLNKFYTHFSQDWHRRDLEPSDIDYYRNCIFPLLVEQNDTKPEHILNFLTQEKYKSLVIEALTNDKFTDADVFFRELLNSDHIKDDNDSIDINKVDFSVLDKTNGIPWSLPTLQDGLGSLVQGQFIVVSADYGTGKSAFVISQVASALNFLKSYKDRGPILYFNSEGTAADVWGRILSNIYRFEYFNGFEDVITYHNDVRNRFIEDYGDRAVYVFQILTGDYLKIIQKMERYKPSLVVIDITDVLAPEENVFQLKKLYDNLRFQSAKLCPIIATTQSGDTSYQNKDGEIKHRRWLSDKCLYGSKAGKGGAADTIITIGKDDDYPEIRYLSTPKKKRGHPVNITCTLIDKYSYYEEII